MLHCGLLGKKLGHSYSPEIHRMLGDYGYGLFEREEKDVEAFLKGSGWDGLNVTIPYKRTVVPYLDRMSPEALAAGCVNTVVRMPDGILYGDNTDVYGFSETVRRSGIRTAGAKALIFGSGGASAAARVALREAGADVTVVSRKDGGYGRLDSCGDAEIVVNATPLGMFPETGVSPADLKRFPACGHVFDVVYNPARTALLLQAEELGIPCDNGLYMLVAQAAKSSERFTGNAVPEERILEIHGKMRLSMQNIVLIGMAGTGKSSLAREIALMTGRTALDSDEEIARRTGRTPARIIVESGESAFRELESEVLSDLGRRSGAVIATGGGAVLRDSNYPALHQNGMIVWVRREGVELPSEGRPLSVRYGADELCRRRTPLYRRFADLEVKIGTDVRRSAERVLSAVRDKESR